MVLSTKGLSVAQQQAVLAELSLANATGKLTTAQMTEILTTKSRSKADAEALLLNAGLITSETAEATATNVVTAAKLKELVQTKALTQAEAELIAAKAGVTLANQKESASFLAGIGSKIKGLGSGLKSAGTGILALAKAHPVIAGITTALTIGTVAVGIYKKKQEEAAQAIKEAYENAKTAIDEINSTFENTKSTTESIAKEYAELAQGVNLLTNENKKLSTEKYERFLELSNQLSDLYPSLTKDFDDNGNAILDLSGDVDTIVGSLNDLVSVQEQLANQKIVDQMPAFFEGYRNNVSDFKELLDNAEKTKSDIEKAYEVLNNWDSSTVWWANGGNVSGTGTMGEYVNALETLGIAYKKVSVDLNNDPYKNSDGFSIEADYDEFGTELHDIYVDKFNKASDEVKYAKMQLDSETSSINQYLNTWLQTEFSYNQLENDGLKQAIRESLFNFDWNSLPKDIDKNDWEAVSEYLRRNILFSVNNIDDASVSQALADIYTGALSSGDLLNAIEKVQNYFGDEHPISFSLEPKVGDVEPLMNSVKDKLKGTEFDDKVGELNLGDLQIAAEQVDVPLDSIESWEELLALIQKVKEGEKNLFSSFDDSIIGERLQHITEEFENGSLSHKEYFDALQSEIDNVDFSNYTNSLEDANEASQQFFTDSIQQVASGLSGLINDFDSGKMSISEYLEGYLSIGNTLSTLTDNLQENSSAWNENGEAMSDATNSALDNTQSQLQTAMSTIESYQDSIYSLEQILTDSVKEGTDEFTAHTNVIAQDLYNIVQTGGIMADEIKNTLGTTTGEIAKSLTENVSNQELACQAIMGNTNTAIQNMATAIGELFDTLGEQISNFKVDLNFGVKSIDWNKVNVLGAELSLPEIKFELDASGDSLKSIGDAVSSFGKTISSNFTPQTISLEDFHFRNSENGKDDDYTPSSDLLKNYEDALNKIKDSGSGSSSSSSKDTKQEFNWIEHRNELLQRQHDILSKTAEDETKSYNERISALNELITMDKERIAFAQEAKEKYESIYNKALQNHLLEKEFGAISEVIGSYGEQQEEANVQALQLIEAQKEFEEASAGLATEAIEAITSQQPNDPNRNSAFDLLGTSEEKIQEAADTMASAETEAIAKAKDAYEEYVALKENSILSESDLQALVENGGMFIGEYDQETSDAINKVVDAYKQMLEYSDQLEETEEEQLNHKREALKLQEEIIKAQQEQLNAEISRIDAELDYLESSGGVVTEGYYKEQIRLSKELTEAYEDQINNLYEQRDLVDDGSAEYYSLSAQIEDCEQQIIECKTQQEEWNEAIKRLPVDRMQKYINMLKAIKQELDDFLSYQETIGQATTKDQFQQLLEINEEQVKTLQKQSTELLGLLDDYDYGSEKFNEVAEELSSIQNETANLVNEMQEYNNEILQIPINKLEEVNENLEKYSAILQSILDDYDQTLSAVTGVLDAQVSELEKLKEQTEETYKAQIDPLQEQLDLLNKVNEARQMQMQLEQALYNLQKAQNQKTTMIINSKGEKEYVADINAVRDAQKEYQDTLYDKQVYDLETQIKSLEEERDALLEGYDDEIDRLNKISEKWSEIKNEIQLSADILKANQIFGTEEWQEKVVSGNDQDLYDMFKEWYSSTSEQKTQVDEQIASNERIVETMQEFVDRFIDGSISYESALQNVSDLYSKLDSGYSALEELSTFMNMDNLKSLVDIQTSAQEQISENVELLNGYLTIANQNQTLIDNYTSTWEEMSTMIDEQLEALKKAAEALEEWVKNQKYHKGSSYDSDSDGGGNWSGGVESTGIIESGMNGGNYSESHWDAGQSPYSDDDDDIYHRGIEKGEIGKADRTRTEFLRQIATQDMEPDERYIRAQVGEVVLNDEQQAQLAKNFETLSLANLVPVFSMPELGVGLNTTANDINIQFGDLNLPDVRDIDGFARALTAQFPNIMRQELSKWN